MSFPVFTQLEDLLRRVASYSPAEVLVELAVIGLVVFLIVRFVEGTRAAGALKGLLVVLVVATVSVRILGGGAAFQRLTLLYDRFLAVIAIGLVVIFQPELRRALIRLGEAPIFRTSPKEIEGVIDSVVEASAYFSKAKMGALMVFERRIGLEGLVEGGTKLNARVSARLLQTIFYPGTALHDLAVVIRGRTLTAASVQLPLAEPTDMPDPEFGARHRAAVGLTKESDAVVLIVSEETGSIRLAERGRLTAPMSPEAIKPALLLRLEGADERNARKKGKGSAGADDARRELGDEDEPIDEALEATRVPTNSTEDFDDGTRA
ncbi:MAG: diadenylate cyclase CdaA [Planctomycetota bacterium]